MEADGGSGKAVPGSRPTTNGHLRPGAFLSQVSRTQYLQHAIQKGQDEARTTACKGGNGLSGGTSGGSLDSSRRRARCSSLWSRPCPQGLRLLCTSLDDTFPSVFICILNETALLPPVLVTAVLGGQLPANFELQGRSRCHSACGSTVAPLQALILLAIH